MGLPLEGVILATVLFYLGIVILLEQTGFYEKINELHFEISVDLVLPEEHAACGKDANIVEHC